MAKNAATHPSPAPSPANRPAAAGPALAPVIEINVRHIGRTPQPEELTGSEAPEGWIKKIDRPREGKVWVGFFHLYVTDPSGRPVRKKKEKTLGPATMPKHEAHQKLADYIEEYTGKLIHRGESVPFFVGDGLASANQAGAGTTSAEVAWPAVSAAVEPAVPGWRTGTAQPLKALPSEAGGTSAPHPRSVAGSLFGHPATKMLDRSRVP